MTADQPVLRITSGRPTPAELAAVTAVLLAIAGSMPSGVAPGRAIGGWADPTLRLRRLPPAAPGAWRASAWA